MDVVDVAQWRAESEHLTTSNGQHRVAYRRRGEGPVLLMLHGFPTWSFDWAAVAEDLQDDHTVVTFDFLGYGYSDKPRPYRYSVAESADVTTELLAHLGVDAVDLVIHDYGSIVGQELLDRRRRDTLPFEVRTLTIFNGGLVYDAYRPTTLQRLLAVPGLGRVIAGRITRSRLRKGLDDVRGTAKLTDDELADLWAGISHDDGHTLAHLLIGYNAERAAHHERWEAALTAWDGPTHLVWGLDDPVSGRHVLERLRPLLPHARVTELDGVGHFPMSEAPKRVIAAMRA